MAVGVAAVAGLFFVHTGDLTLASWLFVLALIGVAGSFVFYEALLPHIARGGEIDRVSTAGYALGYVGGGILLALNLAWIQKPAWFGLPAGPGLDEIRGHAAGAAGVPERRGLVAGVLDPAVPAGARAAGAAGAGRAAGAEPRSGWRSSAWARPSASCAATGRHS